ncbi:MAG: hypothetical protein IH612_02460 [Desulfofustis sp.]|nr:hypothetical protein [Desulfofustis sp.]
MISVTSGWRGFREVNRVQFDPDLTGVERLEAKLKESGTYIETVPIRGE